jgi:enoyl-CoA hydratase/carnithine racemase
MSDAPVLLEMKDKIAQITLNRPDNRNSMDSEMMPAFFDVMSTVKDNRELRCLIITGSGKSFCAGADFKGVIVDDSAGLPHEVLMGVYEPFLMIQDIAIPTIAAMNGHAIGGGFGLMLICDIRIANKVSKYGGNFARLGLHTGMAVSYMLPRLVGLPMANELLFTGRLISGEQTAEIGLANYAVEQDQVLEKAWELAREIASCAPAAVRLIKRSILRGLEWDPRSAAEIEAHCQSRTVEMEDAKEGITALLEKREPVFRGR